MARRWSVDARRAAHARARARGGGSAQAVAEVKESAKERRKREPKKEDAQEAEVEALLAQLETGDAGAPEAAEARSRLADGARTPPLASTPRAKRWSGWSTRCRTAWTSSR